MVLQRLLNQQLLSPLYGTPAQVVAHMGAMQAQEYRMMRWAVAMRTQKPSAQAFADDYNSGRIVRLHLMRGTWQLVSGADYWWMLGLFSDRSKKVINGWMRSSKITIDTEEYCRIRDILIDTAQCQRSVAKEDFVQALAVRNIVMDDHRLSYHIRMAELDGILCSGDLQPMKMTYSLASIKMGHPTDIDHETSLHEIARRYFQSHSPATLEDFVWWTGLTTTDCKRGIASLGKDIHIVHHNDQQFYILEGCRSEGQLQGSTILLPSYDEYLIGYKSRDLVLAPQHSHHAHTQNGIFFPIILRNGMAVGNWKPYEQQLAATLFHNRLAATTLQQQWEKYKQYLSN